MCVLGKKEKCTPMQYLYKAQIMTRLCMSEVVMTVYKDWCVPVRVALSQVFICIMWTQVFDCIISIFHYVLIYLFSLAS